MKKRNQKKTKQNPEKSIKIGARTDAPVPNDF